jgi:tetratricopeptide (TPR) repeat protein
MDLADSAAERSEEKGSHAKPKPIAWYHDEARIAERANDLGHAAALLDAVLLNHPGDFETLVRRSRVALAAGNQAEAKDFALRARAISPRNPKPAVLLARIAEREGQRSLAVEIWRGVSPLDDGYNERLVASARMLAALERPEEALANLELAVVRRSSEVGVRRDLAKLLSEMGFVDRAAAEWQAILEMRPSDKEAASQLASLSSGKSPSASLLLRYRSAMRFAANPLALAVGEDRLECLLASCIASAMAKHFGVQIDIIVTERTPVTDLIFESNLDVGRLVLANESRVTYEVALLLPGFVHSNAGCHPPSAALLFDYSKEVAVSDEILKNRHSSLIRWMAPILSMEPSDLLAGRPCLERRYSGAAEAPVGVVYRDITGHKGAAAEQLLRELASANLPAVRVDLAPDQAAAELLQTLSGTSVVICEEEATAMMLGVLGIPVIFLASYSKGHLLTQVVPGAVILDPQCECFACGDRPEDRWRALTRSCQCSAKIEIVAVLQAVEQQRAMLLDPDGVAETALQPEYI